MNKKLNKGIKGLRSAALKQLDNVTLEGVLRAFGLQAVKSVKKKPAGVLASFGVGVVLGAGLGLAFAPTSGAHLREHILGLMRSKSTPDDAASAAADEDNGATSSTTARDRSGNNSHPRVKRADAAGMSAGA